MSTEWKWNSIDHRSESDPDVVIVKKHNFLSFLFKMLLLIKLIHIQMLIKKICIKRLV